MIFSSNYFTESDTEQERKVREEVYDKVEKILQKNDIKYDIPAKDKDRFIKRKPNMFGNCKLCISVRVDNENELKKLCSLINKEIAEYNGHVKRDNYNTLFLSCNESAIYENELALPNEENTIVDLATLLDNTDNKKIYLTSDWHLFQTHYKHEKNYVNTQEIVTWCCKNIKDDDIFMYLGDISFRYCNEEDQKRSMEIMASLPGIKVLIAGNHDRMLGDEYINGCGFKYVFDEFIWNNLVFTHRPINMALYSDDYWNIHGHIHKWTGYNTTDGKKNINVYPYFYNNKPVTLDHILNHKETLVKDNYWNDNAMLSEAKRSELPDSSFGIPEDRKFPLDTKAHVKSAIKLFGHAEEDKKKQLAKNIRSAAKKYDLSIPETTQCHKYLSEGGLADNIPENVNVIVFDMGSVLIDSDLSNDFHRDLVVSHLLAHEIRDLVHDKIFANKEIDTTHFTVDQIKDLFLNIAPDNIKPYTNKIFDIIGISLFKFSYVDELIDTLRLKGYSIYYLSNWEQWAFALQENFFRPLINKFDGGLFSFESKYQKPEKEFYQEFFELYDLNPEKCFFFDDKSENISTGESFGMRGMVFNSKETPNLLFNDNFNIPSDANNTILIDNGVRLETANLNNIKYWYCSNERNPDIISENSYCDNIIDAIKDNYSDKVQEMYVFTYNGKEPIILGKILTSSNESYEWLIQYPIEYRDGIIKSNINEWSMAACNPITGISKPFILKISNDSGSIINTKQYAFSPDIISDKYLVVNEDAKLEIVDSDIFKDCYIEVYEFTGNKSYIGKLYEAYEFGKIVDNTIFYTLLSQKPMLCEDQIDFDPNFKKVDFELMKENVLSEMATIRDNVLVLSGNPLAELSLTESVHTDYVALLSKYNNHGDLSIKKDLDGYYLYSNLTNKRSSSVQEKSLLTESMIKSIL